jgi:hypothetical protein
MRFFLGIEEKMAQDERVREDGQWQDKKHRLSTGFSKTRAHKRQTVRARQEEHRQSVMEATLAGWTATRTRREKNRNI